MTNKLARGSVRNLVVVLGDQLDRKSSGLEGFHLQRDAVWMAEVAEEAEHVWSHQARIALFLSAMRHYRDDLRERGVTVHYRHLDDPQNQGNLTDELAAAVQHLKPQRVVVVQPGEWRVAELIRQTCDRLGLPLEVREDRHFLCSLDEFARFARARRQMRLEHFYRFMRRQTEVLMDGEQPLGGKWNLDGENRRAFPRGGPPPLRPPRSFRPDPITQEVLALVARRFPQHPGNLRHFDWPVSASQAQEALADFVQHRLPHFGPYQDAMWSGQPYLFHSRLAAALNLKLLDARDTIAAAETAYHSHQAPLNCAEGFVRQILGWREFVRGVYWLLMPEYLQRNALGATRRLPAFYWTADTELRCLRETLHQTLEYGYAHHIQRLMIAGLFPLLLGVDPRAVHAWFLAVYVDAVEWVELPNTLGMSQFADGGVLASKPYAASGKYIQRMSNYCRDCRFNPADATGDDACPFTTLYWDFLLEHQHLLSAHPRMQVQLKSLQTLPDDQRHCIQTQAQRLRDAVC